MHRLPLRSDAKSTQTVARRQCRARSQSDENGKSPKGEPADKVRKAVDAMRRDGVDEKVARKVRIRSTHLAVY